MPQFLVKTGKVTKDGKTYRVGERVELTQEIANRVQKGMLEPVPVKGRGEPVPMERPAQAAQEPEEKPAGVQDEPRGRRRG